MKRFETEFKKAETALDSVIDETRVITSYSIHYTKLYDARAEKEGVDAAHHLGDGERGDVSQPVGLAHTGGRDTGGT